MTATIEQLTTKVWPSLSDVGKFVTACGQATEAIRESIEPKAIGDASYVVRRFSFNRNEGWTVRSIGTIIRKPVGESERPGKFSKFEDDPQQLLTSFFEKSDAYMNLRDEDVWAVAVDWLNEVAAVMNEDARTLENALNHALLARAGILDVPGWQLYTLAAERPVTS